MSASLPSLSSREVCGALKKAGFAEQPGRGKGPHTFLHRPSPPTNVTVPKARDIKRSTLFAIIKQAGLTVNEFLDLL